MTFSEIRFKGSSLLDLSIRSQDLRETVTAWLIAEGLIKDNKRASAPFRAGLEEFFIGLVASGGAVDIDTRNTFVWTTETGSRIYLTLIDQMFERGFFDQRPLTGNTLNLTHKADSLRALLRGI